MTSKNSQPTKKDPPQKHLRGGLGNKGNPLAIKHAITEAMRDVQRTGHDLEKIKKHKEELVADLAELHIREKEAEESNLSAGVQELIRKNIKNVQERIDEVNGIIPEVSLSDDQKKIEKIIARWNEAKKERETAIATQKKAETTLAKDPLNARAMGEANRASAIIYDETQNMERAFHAAEIVQKNFIPNPVTDEAINIHTGEDAEKKTGESQKETPPLIQEKPKTEKALEHHKAVPRHHKQRPTIKRRTNEILHRLSRKTEDKEETKEKGKRDLLSSEKPEVDYTQATKDLIRQINHVLAKNKAVVDDKKQNSKEIPVFALKPAESHLLLNDSEHIPESKFASLKKTSSGSSADHVRPHSKEVQTSFLVEKTLLHHLDILFGKKGFLGFGGRAGVNSPHWKDPTDGFAKKTVNDIFRAHPSSSKKNIAQCAGIKNYEATTTMKKYLSQAFEQTKIPPHPQEMVKDYLYRAIATMFGNYHTIQK